MISRDYIHKMGCIKIAYLVLWTGSVLSNRMVYAQSSVLQAVTQTVVIVQLGHWTEGNTDGHHLNVQADHLEVADVSSRLLSQIHDPRAGHLRCNKSNILLILVVLVSSQQLRLVAYTFWVYELICCGILSTYQTLIEPFNKNSTVV